MIKIYHNPRCTKSRQGVKALEESGEQFEIIKYLEDVPTKDELKQLLGYLNLPAVKLVRTNEAIWKENYKGKNMTEDDIITAMIEHPKLIERPIVIKDRKAVIGRPTEQILDLLQK